MKVEVKNKVVLTKADINIKLESDEEVDAFREILAMAHQQLNAVMREPGVIYDIINKLKEQLP